MAKKAPKPAPAPAPKKLVTSVDKSALKAYNAGQPLRSDGERLPYQEPDGYKPTTFRDVFSQGRFQMTPSSGILSARGAGPEGGSGSTSSGGGGGVDVTRYLGGRRSQGQTPAPAFAGEMIAEPGSYPARPTVKQLQAKPAVNSFRQPAPAFAGEMLADETTTGPASTMQADAIAPGTNRVQAAVQAALRSGQQAKARPVGGFRVNKNADGDPDGSKTYFRPLERDTQPGTGAQPWMPPYERMGREMAEQAASQNSRVNGTGYSPGVMTTRERQKTFDRLDSLGNLQPQVRAQAEQLIRQGGHDVPEVLAKVLSAPAGVSRSSPRVGDAMQAELRIYADSLGQQKADAQGRTQSAAARIRAAATPGVAGMLGVGRGSFQGQEALYPIAGQVDDYRSSMESAGLRGDQMNVGKGLSARLRQELSGNISGLPAAQLAKLVAEEPQNTAYANAYRQAVARESGNEKAKADLEYDRKLALAMVEHPVKDSTKTTAPKENPLIKNWREEVGKTEKDSVLWDAVQGQLGALRAQSRSPIHRTDKVTIGGKTMTAADWVAFAGRERPQPPRLQGWMQARADVGDPDASSFLQRLDGGPVAGPGPRNPAPKAPPPGAPQPTRTPAPRSNAPVKPSAKALTFKAEFLDYPAEEQEAVIEDLEHAGNLQDAQYFRSLIGRR